jgi:hypothetical protein
MFRFAASAERSRTYEFSVRQTYSDGTVVDWAGAETSDTPAPTVKAIGEIGGGTSTLAIVALVVAGLALLVGLGALITRGRPIA